MVEVPVVPPRRPYTRVKTALVVGLALVAVACLAPLHSDTAVLLTGAFSGALGTSPAVRAPAATAARTAQVDMAVDRRSWLAALGGLAATAPWPAGAASVLDPPQKEALANSKGAKKPEAKKPEAKKPEVKKPEAKKPEVKKPTPKPTPKPAPKPAPKKAPAKRKNEKKKKGGGLGGALLPAAVIGGGYFLLNEEEGTSPAKTETPAEDTVAGSED